MGARPHFSVFWGLESEASIMPPSWRTRLTWDKTWGLQETTFLTSKILSLYFKDVFTLMMKIIQKKETVCANFKSFKFENYDCGDLENKVKVKLFTCNKRSCHYASRGVELSLLYLKTLLICGHFLIALVIMGKTNI